MGKKLLLADDSVTIQKVVGISFASEAVELITVDNGNDALKRIREMRPDVVLADVVMPGLNGYEVCEALQADPDLRNIPVLLLTGTFESFDEERAARCGAAGHVAKPFEAQALVDQVRMLLARSPEDAPRTTPGSDGVAQTSNADSFDFFEDGMANAEPSLTGALETPDGTPVLSFADEPSAAPIPDPAVAMMQETLSPALAVKQLEPDATSNDSGENTPGDAAQKTILDPKGASGFDIAISDFARPDAEASSETPWAGSYIDALDAPGDVLPDKSTVDGFDAPLAEAAGDPLGAALEGVPADAFDAPLAEAVEDPLGAALEGVPADAFDAPLAEPLPDPLDAALEEDAPADAFDAPLAEPLPDPPATDLLGLGINDPLFPVGTEEALRVAGDPPAVDASHEASAMAGVAMAEMEPRLRESIHDTLEKIAWESLGNLSEQIVRQTVAQVEQIAWEVIPQLAETLIREEIRRMKGGEED